MSEMTPKQMENSLQHVQNEFGPMLMRFMDVAKARIAARSRQEYMRDAGFTTPPFPPRKKRSGPLRLLSGRLERSLRGSMHRGRNEHVSEINSTKEGVKITYGTRTPYAHVHEEGFIGQVQIPAHQRTIVQAFGRPLSGKKTVNVSAHTRFMVIPARPFLNPATDDKMEELEEWLAGETQDLLVEAVDG